MRNMRLIQAIPEPQRDKKGIRQLVAEITPTIGTGGKNRTERIIPESKGAGMFKNARLTMTIPEFAEATGCSRNLAYSLARQDKLPVKVIYLGAKKMCVSRKAVLDLLGATVTTEEHLEHTHKMEGQ